MQLPVRRPGMLETTSLGAAYAAGIGAGIWSAEWVLHRAQDEHQEYTDFLPDCDAETTEGRYKKWKKAVRLSFDLAEFTD